MSLRSNWLTIRSFVSTFVPLSLRLSKDQIRSHEMKEEKNIKFFIFFKSIFLHPWEREREGGREREMRFMCFIEFLSASKVNERERDIILISYFRKGIFLRKKRKRFVWCYIEKNIERKSTLEPKKKRAWKEASLLSFVSFRFVSFYFFLGWAPKKTCLLRHINQG